MDISSTQGLAYVWLFIEKLSIFISYWPTTIPLSLSLLANNWDFEGISSFPHQLSS
jgi:hypothetical protein